MRFPYLIFTVSALPGFAFPQTSAQNGSSEIQEIIVTGDRNYLRPAIVSASKTNINQRELPINVSAVTRQLLDDQQAFRVADGLKNIASFQSGYSYGPLEDTFYLRGFSTGDHFGSAAYRDGVRIAAFNIPTAGLEAVEVLKGPASALYGRAEPGGIINFVTKKASQERVATLEAQMGSHDFGRLTADIGGPLGAALSYRAVIDTVDTESFRDFVGQEQTYFLGALAWQPGADTRIELQGEVRNLETNDDIGIPSLGKRPAPIPLSRYLGEPGAGEAERDDYVIDLDIEHDLSADWLLRAKAYRSEFDQFFIDISFRDLDPATGDLERSFFADDNLNEVSYGMLELAGQVTTDELDHDVLFGVDYYETSLSESLWYNFTDFGAINPINIYNPVYGNSRRPLLDPAMADPYGSENSWTGLYAQDLISLGEKWRVMLGLRHDWANFSSTYSPEIDESQTSGRLGVVYLLNDTVSLFATTANGFGRSNGRGADDQAQPSEESVHWEAGVKYAPPGDRLLLSAAYYRVEKQNVKTDDPSTPDDPFDSLSIGKVRSQGFDLDAAGWLTARWSVQGSYAYNDLEVTEDLSGLRGLRLQNVPETAVSLWNRYDFTPALTAGIGVYYIGERPGDDFNTYFLPDYTRVDLMGEYRFQIGGNQAQLTFNINNILDEEYFGSGSDFYSAAVPGETRNFRLGIRLML